MTPDLQRDVMRGTSVAPGKVYGGRASGTPDDRLGLENRLRALGEGDVPVVSRLHRLGCKLTHLVGIVEMLSDRRMGQRVLSRWRRISHASANTPESPILDRRLSDCFAACR